MVNFMKEGQRGIIKSRQDEAALSFFLTGVVVFSPYAAIVKEASVKLFAGHQELQTSSILTFYILSFLFLYVLYL